MYKGMYRNCTVLNTNVQRMYRNSVMDLFKNGPNHVIGLGGPLRAATYGENARYHHIWWYLARFELTVLDGLNRAPTTPDRKEIQKKYPKSKDFFKCLSPRDAL